MNILFYVADKYYNKIIKNEYIILCSGPIEFLSNFLRRRDFDARNKNDHDKFFKRFCHRINVIN